jgi:hypothetical protein
VREEKGSYRHNGQTKILVCIEVEIGSVEVFDDVTEVH